MGASTLGSVADIVCEHLGGVPYIIHCSLAPTNRQGSPPGTPLPYIAMATTPSTNTITTVEKVTVTAALNSGAAQLGDLDRTVSTHSGEAQALCDEFHVAPKVDASLDDDSSAPSVTDGTSSDEEACSVEDGCNSEAEFDPPDLPESAPVPRIAIFQEREHGEETIADAL